MQVCQVPQLASPCIIYCMAGNFGEKIFWRIAENMSFSRIYFGGWASLSHMMIFKKKWLVKRTVNLPGRELVSAQLRQNWWWNVTENWTNRCYSYSGLFLSRQSLQRPHTHHLDHLPCFPRQANSSPTSDAQNSREVMPSYAAFNGELHAED